MSEIQPNKFKFELDIRGVDERVLITSPDGWLSTSIKYVRSKLYGGIIRSLTLPMKFVEEGRYLLRKEWYTYALMARVNLYIYKLDPATWLYIQLYFGKLDFSKSLDEFTGFSINATENNINVQIDAYADVEYQIPLTLQTGVREAWISKTGVDPMVDILLTPLKLQEYADFIFSTTSDFRANAFFQVELTGNTQLSVNNSVKSTGFFAQFAPDFSVSPDNFFVAQCDTNIRFNTPIDPITGILAPNGVRTSCNSGQYQFGIYDQNGTVRRILAETPNFSVTTEFIFSFDFSLNVSKDDRLFFYIASLTSASTGPPGVNMQGGSMALTYYTSTPATHAQGLRADFVFDALIQQMNGTDNPGVTTQSRLLAGPFVSGYIKPLSQLVITCSNAILTSQLATIYQAGDALQVGNTYQVFGNPDDAGVIHYFNASGFSTDYAIGSTFKAIPGHSSFTNDPDTDCYVQQVSNNPVLIYSWTNFFKSIQGLCFGQMATGIDPATGFYCMEDERYFYRSSSLALDLGTNIDINWKRVPNLDLNCNAIRGGYNDEQYDALNGAMEVCSTVEWVLPNVTPTRKVEFISPTGAAPYSIEQIRILPGFNNPPNGSSGNFYLNSAASRSDAKNWFVWVQVEPDAGKTYYRPELVSDVGGTISGVDAGYYNWYISPKQNLERGSGHIASMFDKMNSYSLVQSSHQKNVNMVTVVGGVRVAESDNVNIGNLGTKIYLPYTWSVPTGLRFNAQELLEINPFGYIQFVDMGVTWRGFIDEVEVDDAMNSPQIFKLRPVPDSDLSKLIV